MIKRSLQYCNLETTFLFSRGFSDWNCTTWWHYHAIVTEFFNQRNSIKKSSQGNRTYCSSGAIVFLITRKHLTGRGRVLPYMGYIFVCCPKGYGFSPVLVWLEFGVWLGTWFCVHSVKNRRRLILQKFDVSLLVISRCLTLLCSRSV